VAVAAIGALVVAAALHRPAEPPALVRAAADQVLAQVEAPSDVDRAERARAAAGDRGAAVALARRYVDLGRAHADPRYHGRAQAVLAPWWSEPAPPSDVLLLRATIRQAVHEFAAARADLDLLIRRDDGDLNARLTRAAVATVTGDLATAIADCRAVAAAGPLVAAACAAPLVRAGGDLAAASTELTGLIGGRGTGDPGVDVWAWTALGELARHRGDDAAAEQAFRAALAVAPTDGYTLAQLADLLLDAHRDRDVVELLRPHGEADNLLLRLAIAETRLRDPAGRVHAKVLRARLEAGVARGDYTHQREHGRYLLELASDARGALRAALRNWELQKESIDARLVLDAAAAAGEPRAADGVLAWNAEHRVTDAVIERARAALGGGR
jgi:hypothetical protein